ncbi:MAG TPA: pyridoxamine 5'-phosphate oxidase [Fimbriimonas sp.]|nr:pyridoxamine 5'-phosphate oxidase [Fimbriimonas sp.]
MDETKTVWTGDLRREYGKQRLHRSDLLEQPIEQFGHWFEEGKPTVLEPNAMALATADGEGRPSVRMVLMKAFDSRGVVFATSYISRKAHEIRDNPYAALLFYWPVLERQVRMTGTIARTSDEESDEIFNSRHPMSRIAARVSRQSLEIDSREELEKAVAEETERLQGQEIPRPSHWGGYRFFPEEFEFWQGGANRLHDRFLYLRNGAGWEIRRLQP